MFYRRPPARQRRNLYPARQIPVADIADSDVIRDIPDIPLPNEAEKSVLPNQDASDTRGFPSISLLGKNLFLDDIILFGLIFLLLQERIEDEFLLILLVYILLF